MRVIFLSVFLTTLSVCVDLNVDKFIAALGSRLPTLNREKVVAVFEKQAVWLNVTTESHVDACTNIIEDLSNKTYAHDDPIFDLFNATEIEEIFKIIMRNGKRFHAFVDEKMDIIENKCKKFDWASRNYVSRMRQKVTNAIYDIGELQTVTEKGMDKVINELKSKVLGLYHAIAPAMKIELEKTACAQTLTQILEDTPVINKTIHRFDEAKSIFMDDFIIHTKRRGNYSVEHAVNVLTEEANRIKTPVQQHIEQCMHINSDIHLNFTVFDASLKVFNQQNLRGMELNTTFDLHVAMLDEAPVVWDQVVGLRDAYILGYHSLNEEGKHFIDRIFQIAKDGLLNAINNRTERLTSQIFFELIQQNVVDEFRNLSPQLKIDIEKAYCVFTSLRIFHGSEKTIKMIEFLHSTAD